MEIDNDPHHFQAMLYLADAQMQMNHMEEARPLLESLVKLNPASSMAHLDLGIVYADAGRKDEARTELQAAEKIAPTDVNVHWRLGRLYRSIGNAAAANAEFDKARSLNKAADTQLLKIMSQPPVGDHKPHEGAAVGK